MRKWIESNMDIAVLFSGGKDSCYTIMKSIEANLNVKVLLTLHPKSEDSWLFHHPCIRWTKLQAEAMNLQIATYNIESEGEDEKYELSNIFKISRISLELKGLLLAPLQVSIREEELMISLMI
ncbi:MAG: hypothetical protein WBF08_04535 [Candidatus Bathyarchaeia archaeon]